MISTKDKIGYLEERLEILATLEYETLQGIEKTLAGSKEKHFNKYLNNFIGKVMSNVEIVAILDAFVKK